MIIGFLFKLLLFYMAYRTIRGLYHVYKTLQVMKSAQDQWKQKTGQTSSQQGGHSPETPEKGNSIEAEYRVLDENDKN